MKLQLNGYVVAKYPVEGGTQWFLIVPPRDDNGNIIRDGCPPGLIDIVEGPVQVAMHILGITKKHVRARQNKLVRSGREYYKQVTMMENSKSPDACRSLIESSWLYLPNSLEVRHVERVPGDVRLAGNELIQDSTKIK